MEELGLFKPRHPLSTRKKRRIERADRQLNGPEIITNPDEVSENEKFQHIDCGAIFVTVDLVQWGKNCPHCQSDSVLTQLRIQGLGENQTEVTDEERYGLLKKAIRGFTRNGKKQTATRALFQMLEQTDFSRLINIREYGKDFSLLEYAIAYGDESALLTLINAGAQVNTSSFVMQTPLHFAVACKKPWAVEILLAHGADPSAFHYRQENPLQYCISLMSRTTKEEDIRAYTAIARLLKLSAPTFDKTYDIFEKQYGNQGINQLHMATQALDEERVSELLAHGINANLPDNQGFTPLMRLFGITVDDNTLSLQFFSAALHLAHPDLTLEEFNDQFNIYLENLIRLRLITPLQNGVYRLGPRLISDEPALEDWLKNALCITRHRNIGQQLFSRTNLMLTDNYGHNVFHFAIRSIMNRALCLDLFKFGAKKINHFLEYCCKELIHSFFTNPNNRLTLNFFDLTFFLSCCQKIADPAHKLSVLHIAVLILPETEETCKFISRLIYSEAPYAETMLGLGVKENKPTHFVLSKHNTEDADAAGETPLFHAIRSNKHGFVKILASHKASFTSSNNDGKCPRDIASDEGNEEMYYLVEEEWEKATEITEEQSQLMEEYRRDNDEESNSEETASDEEDNLPPYSRRLR